MTQAMSKKTRELTLKELAFIDAYLGVCKGNGTAAVLHAGYQIKRTSAASEAHRLLRKPQIRKEIERRKRNRSLSEIADADERDTILTRIARGARYPSDRIAAIKELNRCSGRHSMTHRHSGHVTLEQILAESRVIEALPVRSIVSHQALESVKALPPADDDKPQAVVDQAETEGSEEEACVFPKENTRV